MADQKQIKNGSDEVDGRTNKMCVPCRKKNKNTMADFFCKECKQYQCANCAEVHEDFDFMSGHDIVSANQAPQLTSKVDMKGLDICDRHKKQLEFFCVDDKTLCCSSCAIVNLKICKEINDISAQAKKADLQPDTILQALSEEENTVNKILEFIEGSTTDAAETSQLQPLLSLIDDVKRSLVQKCDALKTKIRNHVTQAQSARKDEIILNVAINREILGEVDKYHQILASVFKHGTQEQKFVALHATGKHISLHKPILKNQKDGLYKLECSIEYNNVLNDLLQKGDHLASVVINKVEFNPVLPRQLKLVVSLDLKQGEYDTEEPFYSGMDFFADGQLAVIDNPNRKLKIYDESLQAVDMFKFSGYRQDVHVVSEDEVAVTSGSYVIEFLHVSKTSAITLTRTVETTARYFSICMMNETTFLVSTVNDKRPVRMITATGKESDFNNLPENENNFGDRRSTYIRNEDKLVLSDRFANAVCLYDNNDVLTKCVVTDDRIKEPRGVCVGPEDCVFVCSKGTNSIVQVSSSGRVVTSHKLDMEYPRSLSISKDGKVLVVSNSAVGVRKLQKWKIL